MSIKPNDLDNQKENESLNENSGYEENKSSDSVNDDSIEKRIKTMKKIDIVMAIAIVVIIIIILLLRGCGGGDVAHGDVDIPGNIIDPVPSVKVPEAKLDFNTENETENIPFDVEKMDEDSSESISYRVVATYNSDFILKYDMEIRSDEEFQKLAEILKIKVELNNETLLYEGLLCDMDALEIELKADDDTTTEYLFNIVISLDSKFGDGYYGKTLMADMSWWIEDQDYISVDNNKFTTGIPVPPIEPPVDITEMYFVDTKETDNKPFEEESVRNKDIFVQYYSIEVIHDKDVEMLIDSTTVRDAGLGDILKVKVLLVGGVKDIVLYEGLLDELSTSHVIKANSKKQTNLYYKIVVEADGLTEDYQGTRFTSNFSWTLKDTSWQLKVSGNRFVAYKKPYTPPTPPTVATSIKLTNKDGYDNVPFEVENMLPGDTVSQYYCVTVTHESKETVGFEVSLDLTQKLSAVMRIKVEQLMPDADDIVLYDGLMKDCSAVDVVVKSNNAKKSEIYYRITVYTNGSEVGNEYIGESLEADFIWQIR